jgi:deoxyribodipyrimidine photolyase-related protein
MKTLRIILWDQLSHNIAALKNLDLKNDLILMCEVHDECTYVKHHQKKLVFLLSAMRHFAAELSEKNVKIAYVTLDAPDNTQTLSSEIERHATHFKPDRICVTWPGEYRILQNLLSLQKKLKPKLEILEDDRFLASSKEFNAWADDRPSVRMEFFYREMRKKYNILIKDGQPEGGKWNYDAENRHFPKNKISIPTTQVSAIDDITRCVIDLVKAKFNDHFGDIDPFHYAVTRDDALLVLARFIKQRLSLFGDYQDVMMMNEPWMFHSHISFYLNTGLLQPLECIKAAEAAYECGKVTLNSAEGFIRQILGWREFVRGIYWLKMPEYKNKNYFNATLPLPEFFWTANTNMNCIKQCVTETKQNAYAHHIQRLMVLGNFALLAGIDPAFVNEWYLLVYADAHEWVELPNVTGMILFADGGYLASKPYAASGAYINKMSNYCQGCHYNVKVKNGEDACPFNYLYWDFLLRHREQLKGNQRLSMIYATLSKMSKEKIDTITADAKQFLSTL